MKSNCRPARKILATSGRRSKTRPSSLKSIPRNNAGEIDLNPEYHWRQTGDVYKVYPRYRLVTNWIGIGALCLTSMLSLDGVHAGVSPLPTDSIGIPIHPEYCNIHIEDQLRIPAYVLNLNRRFFVLQNQIIARQIGSFHPFDVKSESYHA